MVKWVSKIIEIDRNIFRDGADGGERISKIIKIDRYDF